MKKNVAYACFSLISCFGIRALAEDVKPDTPTTLNGGKVVSVIEAKEIVDKGAVLVFDTRSAINFGKGHLSKAKLISYKEKSEFKVNFDQSQDKFEIEKLPADKKSKILFYSDGLKGWKSYKAAVITIKAGYTDVLWMRDGTTAWTEKKFPLEQ